MNSINIDAVKLRNIMLKKGETMTSLHQKSGVARMTIYNIMNGKFGCSRMDVVSKIANTLGVDASEFVS